MLTCDAALELISAQLDGALSPQEEAFLNEHLQTCAQCRALQADLQRVHAALLASAAQWKVEPPAGLSKDIMAAVHASKVTPFQARRRAWRRRSWASLAAVLAVVLLGGGSLRLWLGSMAGGGSSSGAAAPAGAAPSEAYSLAPEPAAAPEAALDLPPLPEPDTEAPALDRAAGQMPFSGAKSIESGLSSNGADGGGPYCGVLTLPAAHLPQWSQREDFVLLDGARAYRLSAADFSALAEQASAWDGVELLAEGEDISAQAPEGLVILTGPFESETP